MPECIWTLEQEVALKIDLLFALYVLAEPIQVLLCYTEVN